MDATFSPKLDRRRCSWPVDSSAGFECEYEYHFNEYEYEAMLRLDERRRLEGSVAGTFSGLGRSIVTTDII